MDGLVTECDDLGNRQQTMHDDMLAKLEGFKTLLKNTKDSIGTGICISTPADEAQNLQTMQLLKAKAKKLQFGRQQKEFQSALSKFGKDIERKFKQDLSVIYHPEAFSGKEHLVGRALAMHFIRQGQFDLCDAYMKEAGIQQDNTLYAMTEHLKKEFHRMYAILKELEAHHLDSAIEWASANREALAKDCSSLEFNLHRLRILQLKQERSTLEAIQYTRAHFAPFGDKHLPEIKRLMTGIIQSSISESKYVDLLSPTLWVDIRQEFQHDFCSLLNMSAESPLFASALVGTTALPIILKLYKIMSARKTGWSQQDELAVEIPLEEELRFHSVFACPVSKEQATDENPPMMMPCGHVICKESLARLSRSSRYGSNYDRNATRFKCPYCPSETSVDQAIEVYF
ncbi:CTLH/CRA C-terminal to lish motif domain-containing protein [Phycomyces blakesleeanus]|uniref:CTLH/CRA C-terminal to lish motif domain-containing protein n=1 Tax=Phycomyces blakesleeanus TaxID=4837 RepID=A0ABR3BEJ2_PHYBL